MSFHGGIYITNLHLVDLLKSTGLAQTFLPKVCDFPGSRDTLWVSRVLVTCMGKTRDGKNTVAATRSTSEQAGVPIQYCCGGTYVLHQDALGSTTMTTDQNAAVQRVASVNHLFD